MALPAADCSQLSAEAAARELKNVVFTRWAAEGCEELVDTQARMPPPPLSWSWGTVLYFSGSLALSSVYIISSIKRKRLNKKQKLISLVDHFVPFLPLARPTIEALARAHLRARSRRAATETGGAAAALVSPACCAPARARARARRFLRRK